MRRKFFFVIGILLFCSTVAQAADPLCISLKSTADDQVGQSLENSIESKIILSDRMEDNESTSMFCLVVSLVTIQPDDSKAWTTYSASYLLRVGHIDFYLTSRVGVCGANRVSNAADDIINQGIVAFKNATTANNPELLVAIWGIVQYYQEQQNNGTNQ